MIKFLSHLFVPKFSNNYRAALLHHKLLLLLTIFFLSAGILTQSVKTNFPSVLGISSDITNEQLLSLTNSKRGENGASELSISDQLSQAAANKAADMFSKNYWAHNAPDGTTPWVFIKSSGYSYVYAGENLARGFTNSADVINAWMESPEHKENMLSNNYKNVGFSVAVGTLNGEETILIVEMLGSTNFAAPAVVDSQAKAPEVAVAAPQSPSVVPASNIDVTPTTVVIISPTPVEINKNETLGIKNDVSKKTNIVSYNPSLNKALVNGASFTSLSAKTILSIFIFVLILDMVLIERKKVVRFVGHNLDHIFLFSLILIMIIIISRGAII